MQHTRKDRCGKISVCTVSEKQKLDHGIKSENQQLQNIKQIRLGNLT